jgi:hypothetical protein
MDAENTSGLFRWPGDSALNRPLSLGTPTLRDSSPLYRGRYNRHSLPGTTRKEASFDLAVGRPFCTNVQRPSSALMYKSIPLTPVAGM